MFTNNRSRTQHLRDQKVGMPCISAGAPATRDRRRQKLFAILLAALVIRIVLVFYFDTWHVSPEGDHWSFGFETGRVARSLAEGRGFESPFQEPTGPTAWLAPGYP